MRRAARSSHEPGSSPVGSTAPRAAHAAMAQARARHRPVGRIAPAATFVSTLHGGPQLLFALFFGVAFHFLSQDARAAGHRVLCTRRAAPGRGLGVRITATQIAGRGLDHGGLIVIAAVVTTLLCGTLLGRRRGLTRPQGVLSGGGRWPSGAPRRRWPSRRCCRATRTATGFTLTVVVTVTGRPRPPWCRSLVARALHLPPGAGGPVHRRHHPRCGPGGGRGLHHRPGQATTPPSSFFRVSMLAVVVVMVSALFAPSARLRPSSTTARSRAWCPGSCGCSSRWWPSTRWAGCRRAPRTS
ncbi:Jouberin [Manis javanica]|nr:Jouberin [Manis javanica]